MQNSGARELGNKVAVQCLHTICTALVPASYTKDPSVRIPHKYVQNPLEWLLTRLNCWIRPIRSSNPTLALPWEQVLVSASAAPASDHLRILGPQSMTRRCSQSRNPVLVVVAAVVEVLAEQVLDAELAPSDEAVVPQSVL